MLKQYKKTHPKHEIRANLILQLSLLSGHKGLAGGQSLYLLYEKKNATEKNIVNMHELKTAKLFEFCLCAPLIMSNINDIKISKQAQKYGKNFGFKNNCRFGRRIRHQKWISRR